MNIFDAESHRVGRLTLVRVLPAHTVEVILLSDRFVPLTTHWIDKSVVCPRDECVLCSTVPQRGLFYVPVDHSGKMMLLELPAMAAAHLEQHLKLLHGGMAPGQVLHLTRRGKKSPIYSECIAVRPGCSAPPLLFVLGAVMAIYQYPPPNPGEDVASYDVRIHKLAVARAKVMSAPSPK